MYVTQANDAQVTQHQHNGLGDSEYTNADEDLEIEPLTSQLMQCTFQIHLDVRTHLTFINYVAHLTHPTGKVASTLSYSNLSGMIPRASVYLIN